MEQKIILKETNKCIFFLNNENSSFYIIIPRNQRLSLVVSIFNNVNEALVKSIQPPQDKAIIVPIINTNVLEDVKNGNGNNYLVLEKFLANAINTAYKLLSFNKIEVNNKIIIDYNEEYSRFYNWYILKYKERIELLDLGLHKSDIISKPLFENVEQKPADINVPLTNFAAEETLNKGQMIEDNEDEIPLNNSNVKEESLGFVSYVLLGVIVAVVSLVILYKLI